MKISTCLLLGKDAAALAIAEDALRASLPGAGLAEVSSWAAILNYDSALSPGLLVSTAGSDREIAAAHLAVDSFGLPRWGIILFGNGSSEPGIEFVSAEEWTSQALPRIVRAAAEQLRLRRENARLRGDLRAISRRVIHDLRTPLSGISTAGEALQEVLSELDPQGKSLAKPLFASVGDLKRLLERVSLLTNASANPIPMTQCDMGEALFRSLQRVEPLMLSRGAVITQAGQWPEVLGVLPWLEAVWCNLLTNAIQHGSDRPRIELGWAEDGSDFKFWVADAQAKVRPELVESLFQPFNLLHQANARRGLGLSIVQRLLELQAGTCGYEERSQGGSAFFFKLPRIPATRSESQPFANSNGPVATPLQPATATASRNTPVPTSSKADTHTR